MDARTTSDARRRLHGAGVVLLVLTGVLWHAPGSAQQNPIDGTVRGQIVDERSGMPVIGATVDLIDNVNRIRARGTTDETGAFLLTRIDPGAFRLRVRSVGYSELVTPRWWIESGEAISVVIRVDSEAILLAPLEVVGRTVSASPVLQGFYQRLQYNVGGVFFTREDIEARGPMRITDLLAEVPGARLTNDPGSGDPRRDLIVTFERSLPGPGGGSCPVQVYIDGMLASRGGAVPVDALASPHLLEGIEVYRGLSSVPAEFLSAEARCGVVALWTRRGG